ncbi:MAG: pseudouridine synthase [Lachnospiraceae bacterium]|jgi:16S rRNA pseudouridine516 synthase
MTQRLDQVLASLGFGTRSEVRRIIRNGRVTVNGVKILRPETKTDPGGDVIRLDGAELAWTEHEYLMLNKPAGVITAARDSRQKTVMDLISGGRRGIQPVGRLDKDTTGLLLITDDGDLAHRLLSPAHHVDKTYEAVTDRPIPASAVRAFAEGIVLPDFTARPAELEITGPCRARVTLSEGKFHQVRRMFGAVGVTVTELRRTAFGPLVLDPDLREGEWRKLSPAEEKALKAL